MSTLELAHLNLTSPPVLAFALGLLAAVVRSDLRFPEAITSLLSSYLLFAIGLKGGVALRDTDLGELSGPAVATLALGVVTPLLVFAVVPRLLRLGVADAASLAAHYGSVSAVTFTAATAFAVAAGQTPEGFLPALVALLEVPGIVVALVLAHRALAGTSMRVAVHEVLTGKSVVLLLGGLLIGVVASEQGVRTVEPVFVALFPGVLVLFLLDLGTLAGQRLGTVRRAGWRLVAFAAVTPLLFGPLGVVAGLVAGLSPAGAGVLGAMAASASYIAAPAAVRAALPQADVGLALGAALGVTFPVNLVVGIPLFAELAEALGR